MSPSKKGPIRVEVAHLRVWNKRGQVKMDARIWRLSTMWEVVSIYEG